MHDKSEWPKLFEAKERCTNFLSTSAESHQPEQPQHSNHPEVAQITLAVAEPLHLQSIGLLLHGAANCIFRNLLNISCVTPKMLIIERVPNSFPALFHDSQVSQVFNKHYKDLINKIPSKSPKKQNNYR